MKSPVCFCVGLQIILFAACVAPDAVFGAGTVYLVVGSDTAIWNGVGTVDVYTRYPYYRQDSFTDSNAPIFQVMDPAWRNQFKDSFGHPIKFTWWMMGGNIYRDAINLNVPLANTMTLHLMQQYHGEAIRQFGDELSLHYHTYLWSDYNGTGVFYWNQSQTFNELRSDFDITLAHYLLEENVFPVSFRSGWHFMDQDWQQYLNELVPYCFHDNYPTKVAWYTNTAGPVAGIEDWSRAPAEFVPFHPATNDYQLSGDSPGWNVRSVKIQNLNGIFLEQMFEQASNGVDQVACFWDHLPENFVANIAKLGSLMAQVAASHPTIPFRYCTAVEAMQRWRGLTNQPPPQLSIAEELNGATVSLAIASSVPIFQQRPFVCCRTAFQEYSNVTSFCRAVGANAWVVDLGVPTNLLAKVSVAITDLAGNLATRTLRFLPDDLYLDNWDTEYSEEQGTWTSTTNAAWGTDARLVLLHSNSTAQAGWSLPLSTSGQYRISVQVPAVTNAATNVIFNVVAAGTNVLTIRLPDGIATNQWCFIGSAPLDHSVSNRVEMSVNGTNQSGLYAVADVVRIVPAPVTALPEIISQGALLVSPTKQGYLLRFIAHPGVSYSIERGTNLMGNWSTLQVVTPEFSGIAEYEDEKPLSGQAFYRVRGGGG